MKVLVTGCGRSGTKWLADVLQSLGLDMKHEGEGKLGAVSWCLAAGSLDLPSWHGPVTTTDWLIFHLVREPLATIGSLTTMRRASYEWAARHVPLDPFGWDPWKLALHYWVLWNELVSSRAILRVRVEAVTPFIPPANKRKHPSASWERITRVDPDMSQRAQLLGLRYGYQIS